VADSAQKDSNRLCTFRYIYSSRSIRAGATISWFNDDPGQLHTVSSGLSNSSDKGKELIQA
jgi:hypothetical protein